jgi:hypothetical protein
MAPLSVMYWTDVNGTAGVGDGVVCNVDEGTGLELCDLLVLVHEYRLRRTRRSTAKDDTIPTAGGVTIDVCMTVVVPGGANVVTTITGCVETSTTSGESKSQTMFTHIYSDCQQEAAKNTPG